MGLYCLRGYLVLIALVLINLADGVSHALFLFVLVTLKCIYVWL